ncbi:hypothetical protein CEXT_670771 [Caerostris extrusa]|uniref:Uncharacterized protein n=1 Tax=Caerostris extrusa TaxID=172846 RepID=A0AAV4U7P2_CAEEX|nr:hypothetical protein CEXT_670771 [Caerostris extrusa]
MSTNPCQPIYQADDTKNTKIYTKNVRNKPVFFIQEGQLLKLSNLLGPNDMDTCNLLLQDLLPCFQEFNFLISHNYSPKRERNKTRLTTKTFRGPSSLNQVPVRGRMTSKFPIHSLNTR